ncbi:MAG: peptidoglycan-binding protein [Hyphomonadaceae bacterium]
MTQGPWSVKGIDPKAREIARERAQRQGQTLGQYLNALLLEADSAPFREIDLSEPVPRAADDGDLRRMSQEIDQLSQRLEASSSRASRAISGIDKSILGLMGKVDASGKAQLHALERVTRALGEIESTQTALRSRIDTLESENRGGATLDGLKMLEASLDRLAGTVHDRLSSAENEQKQLRDLFDEKVSAVSDKVDEVARSVDTAVSSAVRTNSVGITGRMDEIEDKMSAAERRIEAGISRISDAASRFELFETKAERAVGDTTWRMERALESNLTRSRAMSKEVLDRVDAIEEKTREAMGALSDAVSRITERVTRAERKSDTAVGVLERAINDIDERTQRPAARHDHDELAQLQQVFQKRLDAFAEDMARPIHTLRADMERRIEDAVRNANPEKLEKLERNFRQLQDQINVTEARQADAVEAMSTQVDRLSRAVDERLRAVETRGDDRSIDDVRREIARLADTIDARLSNVETSGQKTSDSVAKLSASVDERMSGLEKKSAGAIDTVGEQVALVAERLQRRHDESIQRLTDRIAETAAEARPLDNAEIDRLADRLDERVRESERRSAEAISQIGEQVARAVERLQTQHQDSMRGFETRLADSGRSYETKLNDVLQEVQRRMDESAERSSVALSPVQKTVSSLAKRLEVLEDIRRGVEPAEEEAVTRDIPVVHDDFVILDDEPAEDPLERPVAPDALAAVERADADMGETTDIVGVEPPPFDRSAEAQLFGDDVETPPREAAAPVVESDAAQSIDDLLEPGADLLAPPSPPAAGFVADLPSDESRERLSAAYLEEARRAARQGRRVTASDSGGRKGIGKGPLIASAVLTVAVAGGAAFTVMRGKQEAQGDDFAKLDPAAPDAPAADPEATDSVLFSEESAEADAADVAAGILEAEGEAEAPAAAPAAAKPGKPAAAAAATPAPAITLDQAVRDGDPVALHDYALELLQSGEKTRAVQLLKDAAGRGLVMAEYRLAKLYERGEGVPRDIAAARSWTEKAAIGGNRLAMHDLAVFYAEGDAGPQSYAAAVEWFRAAADLGLVDSQYNLAVLYEQGLGVSQDKSEAAYWFEVAGRAGDQDASRRARAMLSDMQPTQAEAIKRKARAYNPKPTIARANGDFGIRPWDVATPAQIAEAQRLLQRLGYSPGTSDGKMNSRTADAIRQFQRANDLSITGEASVSLLRQLRAATLSSGD